MYLLNVHSRLFATREQVKRGKRAYPRLFPAFWAALRFFFFLLLAFSNLSRFILQFSRDPQKIQHESNRGGSSPSLAPSLPLEKEPLDVNHRRIDIASARDRGAFSRKFHPSRLTDIRRCNSRAYARNERDCRINPLFRNVVVSAYYDRTPVDVAATRIASSHRSIFSLPLVQQVAEGRSTERVKTGRAKCSSPAYISLFLERKK